MQPRPVQPTANRADWKIEHISNLVIVAPIHFAEHQDRAVFVGQLGQGPLHLHRTFLTEQVFVHPLTVILRLFARQFAILFDRASVLSSSPPTNGGVEGDAIQPSVKRTATSERGKFEVGLNKRILEGIFGFMP